MGLEPGGEHGSWFQKFRLKGNLQGWNVLAKLKNKTSAGSIIVGAHYDHLGHGREVYPGADDNASGVAAMLETAFYLSQLKARGKLPGSRNIIFAAWSGEEKGILGSSYYMKTNKTIYAALNLDMVGHLRNKLMLQGAGSSADWNKLIEDIKTNYPISFVIQKDPYLPTDATAFYVAGVPVLNLFTGAHDNYHTPRDKPNTLNYRGIKTVSDILNDLVLALASKQGEMHYAYIKQAHEYADQKRRVYLGTIPDYASEEIDGVRLSGVSKDSPAARAGLKRDDIVIALAGKKIHDIYNYTEVLNALRPGKAQKMEVLREKTKYSVFVVPR